MTRLASIVRTFEALGSLPVRAIQAIGTSLSRAVHRGTEAVYQRVLATDSGRSWGLAAADASIRREVRRGRSISLAALAAWLGAPEAEALRLRLTVKGVAMRGLDIDGRDVLVRQRGGRSGTPVVGHPRPVSPWARDPASPLPNRRP